MSDDQLVSKLMNWLPSFCFRGNSADSITRPLVFAEEILSYADAGYQIAGWNREELRRAIHIIKHEVKVLQNRINDRLDAATLAWYAYAGSTGRFNQGETI